MKIVTKKQMRLDELIKYVWENDIENKDFLSNEELPCGKRVRVHVNPRRMDEFVRGAGLSIDSGNMVVTPEYTFTLTVEEELSEETVFDKLTALYWFGTFGSIETLVDYRTSISKLKNPSLENARTMAIYYEDTPIWSKITGIPSEGTLEI